MNIWVNGCFDVLHTGHIDLLEYAKNIGDCENTLFVGIDSDNRVKEMKGEGRPINSYSDRRKMLSSLKFVDVVKIFSTDNELSRIIRSHRIDFIVVGDQYKDKKVIGAENSKYGVLYYPVDERSSTNIIKKIKES